MEPNALPTDIESVVLYVVAAELYRTGILSLARAIRFSHLSAVDFINYLASSGIEIRPEGPSRQGEVTTGTGEEISA